MTTEGLFVFGIFKWAEGKVPLRFKKISQKYIGGQQSDRSFE